MEVYLLLCKLRSFFKVFFNLFSEALFIEEEENGASVAMVVPLVIVLILGVLIIVFVMW